MKKSGYEHDLRRLLEARGWSAWELSRHGNVKLQLVDAALRGAGSVPVEALRRLAHVLEAEVTLSPLQLEARAAGAVESVVDRALRVLEEHQETADVVPAGRTETPGLRRSDDVGKFIDAQRGLLDRLERFAETPGFQRLQATLAEVGVDDSTAWLCEVLVRPVFGLAELPIDVVQQPGGLDEVDSSIRRFILNPIGAS